MGVAHSIFIARVDSDEEKKAIEKYDILDQSDLDKWTNREEEHRQQSLPKQQLHREQQTAAS